MSEATTALLNLFPDNIVSMCLNAYRAGNGWFSDALEDALLDCPQGPDKFVLEKTIEETELLWEVYSTTDEVHPWIGASLLGCVKDATSPTMLSQSTCDALDVLGVLCMIAQRSTLPWTPDADDESTAYVVLQVVPQSKYEKIYWKNWKNEDAPHTPSMVLGKVHLKNDEYYPVSAPTLEEFVPLLLTEVLLRGKLTPKELELFDPSWQENIFAQARTTSLSVWEEYAHAGGGAHCMDEWIKYAQEDLLKHTNPNTPPSKPKVM